MNESLAHLVIVVGTAIALRLHQRLPRHREREVLAWVLTLPAAALVAGLVLELAVAVGSGATGSVVMAVLDVAVVALAALVCVAALVIGFVAMTHK